MVSLERGVMWVEMISKIPSSEDTALHLKFFVLRKAVITGFYMGEQHIVFIIIHIRDFLVKCCWAFS